jgi:hypothetical protein
MKKGVLSLLVLTLACGGRPTEPILPTPSPTPIPSPIPTPNTCPSVSTCPPARVWKVGIRECADVKLGEGCLIDTTPFFLGGRCNAEDRTACSNVCGNYRECEPDYTRGPDFNVKVLSGSLTGWVRNSDNPYQIRLQGVRGKIRVEACWYEGAADQLGVELDLSGASCGSAIVVPEGYEE